MKSPAPTLLDLLTSQQFRIALLITLGLNVSQIAELLETTQEGVYDSLAESLKRADCADTTALAFRLLEEVEQDLYDERLKEELAELQKAAKRMLEGET
jgi:DNA-binding NarL/FixJ family response regulator